MSDATDFNEYSLARILASLPGPISINPTRIVMSPYATGWLQTLDKWRSADRRRIKRELRKYHQRFLKEQP